MTKMELEIKTNEAFQTAHDAVQACFDALNQGQRKKILKDEKVAAYVELLGVTV